MPTHVDTDAVRNAAKTVLERRVGAVVKIAEAHQKMLDKREEATAAEREHAALWAAGLREGWTEAELKGMDLIPPGRKAPGRPARRRAQRSTANHGASQHEQPDVAEGTDARAVDLPAGGSLSA